MSLASRKIVKTSRPSSCTRCLYFWSVLTTLCFVVAGAAEAQDSIIIGSGLPAIEVNVEAVYYEVNQEATSAHQRPLFDPTKDTVKSRVIKLPPLSSVRQHSRVTSNNQHGKATSETPHVTEATANEALVTVRRSSEPASVAGQSKSENIDNEESSRVNPAEITPPTTNTTEHELAAIPPAGPVIVQEETPGQVNANTTNSITIIFEDSEKEIKAGEKDKLSAFANNLLSGKDMRLQLKSYASDINESSSGARRLSLARALAVRSFLIEAGVNSTKIDVRALGAKNEDGPADRVDLVVAH
jgi:outer membrane protein OmpA-like peptidoglycan-associated protein